MDLFERAIFFIIGAGVGFILGFIVARLREIKEELDEVDECVKHCHLDHDHIPMGKRNARVRDDRGFMRNPIVADVLYLTALLIVLWGVFMAQQAANETKETQEKIGQLSVCNSEYLRAQAQFLSVYLESPPATDPEQREALENYYELLEAYSDQDGSSLGGSPYSNSDALAKCVESNLTEEIKDE